MLPKKKTFPICHVYDKQHEGCYIKCRNITDEMRGKVDKIVKAGAFDNRAAAVATSQPQQGAPSQSARKVGQ